MWRRLRAFAWQNVNKQSKVPKFSRSLANLFPHKITWSLHLFQLGSVSSNIVCHTYPTWSPYHRTLFAPAMAVVWSCYCRCPDCLLFVWALSLLGFFHPILFAVLCQLEVNDIGHGLNLLWLLFEVAIVAGRTVCGLFGRWACLIRYCLPYFANLRHMT